MDNDPWNSAPPSLPIHCPHCDKAGIATVHGSVEDRDPEHGPPSMLSLTRCHACGQGILFSQEDYGEGWDDLYRLWPSQQRPLSRHVPEPLRNEHAEARKCFDVKAYTASAVMVRRILEGVCQEWGVTERGMTLINSLQKLGESGAIDGRLFEWAQELRILGNQGARYTGIPISREDSEDGLALAEALLDYLYVLSKQFDQFKARRASRRSDTNI